MSTSECSTARRCADATYRPGHTLCDVCLRQSAGSAGTLSKRCFSGAFHAQPSRISGYSCGCHGCGCQRLRERPRLVPRAAEPCGECHGHHAGLRRWHAPDGRVGGVSPPRPCRADQGLGLSRRGADGEQRLREPHPGRHTLPLRPLCGDRTGPLRCRRPAGAEEPACRQGI